MDGRYDGDDKTSIADGQLGMVEMIIFETCKEDDQAAVSNDQITSNNAVMHCPINSTLSFMHHPIWYCAISSCIYQLSLMLDYIPSIESMVTVQHFFVALRSA
ncbi:hypothetical protein LOAG_04594 [Loa loa]|uniref:Uncharacterized protein n=1 Tax=Loa loa TaxID=7209 RepID=A0A1S0U225_LOALO|nr:hypothetical protein LOAG_04594 [Loa loa]EFO23894.1 hypothetical protein LOAG_04594 [Loa loa]